ncbi:MAG: hypothetical protein IKN83_08080 [Bacteroidaceae bacterium]|nr:hypothetical protein [Bacteroidaceae bacterium]
MEPVFELLEKPYWVVDILPKQVPKDSAGQYFKLEQYFLKQRQALSQHFVRILLKLNCYLDLELSADGETWTLNPAPEALEQAISAYMNGGPTNAMLYVFFRSENTLIAIDWDSTNMTLYNPSQTLLDLLPQLVMPEGLYVWKP